MAVRPIDGNVLIEWFRPYLHTGEAIPADVVIEDIRSMLTLTPPNEWVSVEDAMPPELKMVLVYCGGLYDVAGWVKDERGEICWTCKTIPEFWRPIPEME